MKKIIIVFLIMSFISCSSPQRRLNKTLINNTEVLLLRSVDNIHDSKESFVTMDTLTNKVYLTIITQGAGIKYRSSINLNDYLTK